VPEALGVLAAAEVALRERFGGVRLTAVETLGGSDRSTVIRASARGGGAPATVIVKVHEPRAGEAVVREPAALRVLGAVGGALGPDLLAVGSRPPLLVLGDLGRGRSLADLLLGDDPAAAASGIDAWGAALGRLHAATGGIQPAFELGMAIDAARLGVPEPASDDMPSLIDTAAGHLSERLRSIGVTVRPAALDELRSLPELLGGGPAVCALTPADACPDNNVLTDSGMALLDFEGAQVRHVAWDASYLTVPWPSCWCAWPMPAQVARSGFDKWREAVTAAMPYVGSEGFDRDVIVARIGWAVATVAWLLPGALEEEDDSRTSGDGAPIPSRRALVQHRLRGVFEYPDPRLPALSALSKEVLTATLKVWGSHSLALAPVFRSETAQLGDA
jgi:hypothetical protein